MEFKKDVNRLHNASELKKQNNTAKKKRFSVDSKFSVRDKRHNSVKRIRQGAITETVDDLTIKTKSNDSDGSGKK